MRDDAVAPVIAVMLILAVAVTFFAAWNAYYVPSMKAQSEISHIKEVETGFLKFSSDIDTAVSMKKEIRLSEPIPLGGGEFAFDPVKSGGELKIWNASPLDTSSTGYFRLNWTNNTPDGLGTPYPGIVHNFSLVKFSYKPVNNFWQDQGYGWMYGNTYVLNTERNLSTPLEFYRWSDVTYGLAASLVEVEHVRSVSEITGNQNCSSIKIRVVNITPDSRHSHISGNGNGMLRLNSSVHTEEPITYATSMYLSIDTPPDRFRNATVWNATLWQSVNVTSVEKLSQCDNVMITPLSEHETLLTFKRDTGYPNMTLIIETTDIKIGAY
ncbi:MAG: hypothetical protein LUQ66_04915 [Methanoregula sp.]|nr:hypothetical protein [Methanoregula sp.]